MRRKYFLWILTILSLLVLNGSIARSQPQPQSTGQKPQKPPTVYGVVLSGTRGVDLTIVDRNGTEIPLKVNSYTTYLANKTESVFEDVVKPGMNVRCLMAADGLVTQIVGRGQVTQLAVSQYRAFMHATDQEWAVLRPQIEKVRSLQRLVDGAQFK